MRYLKIFFLHIEHIFEYRSRSVVWFLISLINPMMLLLFWRGAISANHGVGTTLPYITSCYLLLVVGGALLTAHVEEDVANIDIHEGHLSQYLIRPFPYFWFKFFEEIPYRLLQGGYGIIVCALAFLVFGNLFELPTDPFVLFLCLVITVMAYFLSFYFKMLVGMAAFWIQDIGGLYQLIDILMLVFAGFLVPLEMFPAYLAKISFILPFSYMVYFPVVAFQGKLSILTMLNIIGAQCTWMIIFMVLYFVMWRGGIRKFTAAGQ